MATGLRMNAMLLSLLKCGILGAEYIVAGQNIFFILEERKRTCREVSF